MMALLGSIGTWFLKLLLSGLFQQVTTRIEDDAEQKKKAAENYANTTNDAADVVVDIVKKQAEVKDAIKDKPKDPADPFGADSWNKEP